MANIEGRLSAVVCLTLGILSASHQVTAQEQVVSPAIRAATSSDAAICPELAQTPAPAPRSSLLVPLYMSFGAMQVLDIHSTQLGLKRGGIEWNPMMRGIVGSPVATAAMKMGATAGIILLSEKLRKRNAAAAVMTMVTLTSASAIIVSHNYSIGRR
jgi:hypothetical protein